jgi:hypothetical protein
MKRTGLRWTQALISKLWEVSWDMWQHRNHIKHNTITPQLKRDIDKVLEHLAQQKIRGTQGLPAKDHRLINDLPPSKDTPISDLNIWLMAIMAAREAATANSMREELRLTREGLAMRRFLTRVPLPGCDIGLPQTS